MVITSGAAWGMALTALGMVLTPGPNMLYLVSRSIGQGRRAGLVSLVGTGLGFIIYMVMANLGLSVVFLVVPWLYVGFKAGGAVYIGYLAWQALRPHGTGVFETTELRRDSDWRLFRMGLTTNLLNPKAAILYLAIIPDFINTRAGHVAAQGFTLGAIQIAISMTVNGLIIIAAGSISTFLAARPTWIRWQRRVSGTLLGAVAIVLAREVPERARV